MFRLTGSVGIDSPVSEVFEYVSEWRNAPKFLRGLTRFEPVDMDHQYGLGSRFQARIQFGPFKVDGEMEIIEHVSNKIVKYRSVAGPGVTGTWMFRRQGDRTIVELTNDIELPGGAVGKIVMKLAEAQAHRDLASSLQDLKRQLEGTAQ